MSAPPDRAARAPVGAAAALRPVPVGAAAAPRLVSPVLPLNGAGIRRAAP